MCVSVCLCACVPGVISNQARDGGLRTTIYKRDPSKQYGLKMKTSRMFFSEVERRFDAMPFTLRYECFTFNQPENDLIFLHDGK